jgi:hypothetical protein
MGGLEGDYVGVVLALYRKPKILEEFNEFGD